MKFREFVKKYPKYSRFRFSADEHGDVQFIFNGKQYNPFDKKGNIVKTIYEFPSNHYKPDNIHDFLNADDGHAYKETMEHLFGFPPAFQRLKINPKNAYPVPSIPFSETPSSDVASMLTDLEIFITPTESFVTQTRNIFKEMTVQHKTETCARRWLAGPNFQYWPQQLCFAVWAATNGCGVSINDLAMKTYPPIIQGLLKFHVYYTIRRILYQMGAALPGDPTFDNSNNPYSKPALERLLAEFEVKNEDFRWKHGPNNGLGNLYNSSPNGSISSVASQGMSSDDHWPGGWFHFKDQSGANKANTLAYIENKAHNGKQYNWFTATKAKGLTRLSRLNRSIETLTYCILVSQARSRVSIAGYTGGAIETRKIFQKLLEDSISEDTTSAINRFQRAVTDANCRLNLAISPDLWLMPSSLTINKDSVQGYNNGLQRATSEMSFGVNTDINLPKKEHKNLPRNQAPMGKHHTVTVKNQTPHKPKLIVKNKYSHNTNLAVAAVLSATVGWWLFR